MQATVRRKEAVAGKRTDGLSREAGQAVVRDLLGFEGFTSDDTEPQGHTGFAGMFDAERRRPLTESAVSAVASSADAPDGLDWQTFSAAYFPGRRRHDLEAITAYGAYRRSHTVDERPSRQATRMEEAESGEAGSTGLQDWEDEGGAIR